MEHTDILLCVKDTGVLQEREKGRGKGEYITHNYSFYIS